MNQGGPYGNPLDESLSAFLASDNKDYCDTLAGFKVSGRKLRACYEKGKNWQPLIRLEVTENRVQSPIRCIMLLDDKAAGKP